MQRVAELFLRTGMLTMPVSFGKKTAARRGSARRFQLVPKLGFDALMLLLNCIGLYHAGGGMNL